MSKITIDLFDLLKLLEKYDINSIEELENHIKHAQLSLPIGLNSELEELDNAMGLWIRDSNDLNK